MHNLRKFRELSRTRRLLLMEAGLWLSLAWLLVRTLPFHWWSRWLGTSLSGEADSAGAVDPDLARGVAWAVVTINRRAGGRFTCLMLAMAAHWMLSRRRISSSLVLGTQTTRSDDQQLVMKAHAWLRVGAHLVLGHHDGQFTPVSSFVRTYCQHVDD